MITEEEVKLCFSSLFSFSCLKRVKRALQSCTISWLSFKLVDENPLRLYLSLAASYQEETERKDPVRDLAILQCLMPCFVSPHLIKRILSSTS